MWEELNNINYLPTETEQETEYESSNELLEDRIDDDDDDDDDSLFAQPPPMDDCLVCFLSTFALFWTTNVSIMLWKNDMSWMYLRSQRDNKTWQTSSVSILQNA